MAESLTDKIKLSKRDTGDLNWGQGANANLDAIDAHAQQATLRPPRTLLATLGSGAVGANLLGSTSYFYKVTAVNAAGETTEGKIPATVEAQVSQPSTPLPVILQWELVQGATGYKIYKATASGQEKFLASVSGQATSSYTDDGNTATSAVDVPAANTARVSVSKIVAGANVTVSPADGTGEVTINASGGTPPDASTTVKGVTKLSAAPAVATDPIAVGDNDPRNSDARTPMGAAGGDLSGTYPNPTVADVDGASGTLASKQKVEVQKAGVVQGTQPAVNLIEGAGIALSVADDSGSGRINVTIAASGGGGGYATVVVAAPTGVASTDTANIQAAIDGLPAGGGTVVLREGSYAINAQIILPTGKPVAVIGQGRATKLVDVSGGPFLFGIFKGPASGNMDGILLADFMLASPNTGQGVMDLQPTGTQVFENIKIHRVHGDRASRWLHVNAASGTIVRNVEVVACESHLSSAFVFMQDNAGMLERFTIRDNKTFNDINHAGEKLAIRGFKHVIEGNQFHVEAGSIGGGTVGINGNTENCVIQGNYVRYAGFLAFRTGAPSTAVFRRNVVADNVNDNPDPLIQKSINLTGKGEVSNNTFVGNNLGLAVDLPGASPSGNNIFAANKSGTVTAASSDIVATNFVTGVRKLGEASPLAGDVKLEAGASIGLTQDGANNKVNIAYVGPQGYATVIVAAPTLNAATDTANIQTALDALSSVSGSAGGGLVILREGDYVVNQIIIRRDGTKLIGSGPGWSGNSQIKSGSRIRGNSQANDLVRVEADQVMVENVTFVGFHVADGFSMMVAGQDITAKGQDLNLKNCAFTDIRSPHIAGLRASGIHRLRVWDCLFFMNESVQQTVARTPIAIKIGQAAGGASLNIDVARCHFRHEYLIPGVGGSILAKDIEMTRVLGARIEGCQSLVGSASAGLTFIFLELKQDSGQGKIVTLQGNSLRRHNNFIKQTGAFVKVAVNGNVYGDHQGADPVIDLAGGNTGWALVGNVLEGSPGINLQASADNNVVVGNVANVTNGGTGNQVANNVAP